MGTEIKMLDCRDVLYAFLQHLCCVPMAPLAGTVSACSRLFNRAVRISGWSHLFGNAMKSAVKHFTRWPRIIRLLRSLCTFFRTATWRQQIARSLAGVVVNAAALLYRFTARILKWRYETLFDVVCQLIPLIPVCTYLGQPGKLAEIFSSFQDRELLKTVQEACGWHDLWVFLPVVFDRVLCPLEKARRWGLMCACHVEERKLSKAKLHCDRNSRRLDEAREFTAVLTSEMATRGRVASTQGCQDIFWIAMETAQCERLTSANVDRRTQWLHAVPWRFAESNKPAQAAIVRQQLLDAPEETLDPLSLHYKNTCIEDLTAASTNPH